MPSAAISLANRLRSTFQLAFILSLALANSLLLPTSAGWADEPLSFNRDIRPLLSNRCFACHGPDANTRAADLRLDIREAAVSDDQQHAVILAGDADNSELIRRLTTDDPTERMPPSDHDDPLSADEIALLTRWINEGAPYAAHWSYVPVERPEVPAAIASSTNPVDQFIDARLKLEGLHRQPPADPRLLVRRLAFDLTGLPPSLQDIELYRSHPSLAEYEQLVSQYLSSPAYGERMAQYWLDLVRYADTLGYHGDQVRSVSPYRDYVIRSFNENLPFDQFAIEQIAGDLIPNATLWQRVASTYNRLNRASGEGGVQPKEYLAKYSADRVRTAGSVWLGSTFGCAECHDHKFDPFTTEDFYSFAAFFADIKEQGIVASAVHIEQLPVPTDEQAQRLDELTRSIAETEAAYHAVTPELENAKTNWELQLQSHESHWQVLTPQTAEATNGTTLKILEDGSVLASGPNPDKTTYKLLFESPISSIAAVRLEILPDDSLPARGPGRAGNGNLVINEVAAKLAGNEVLWDKAFTDHTQVHHSAEYLVSKHPNGWAILPQIGQAHYVILTSKPAANESDANADPANHSLEITIDQRFGGGHNLGRFRISVTDDRSAESLLAPNAIQQAVDIAKIPAGQRTAEQSKVFDQLFREQATELAPLRERLAALKNEEKTLRSAIITTLATTSTQPRVIRVLPRGDWMNDTGKIVTPRLPTFLAPATVEGEDSSAASELTRLDLANWLVDRRNPLVARTFVNRLWMLFFGYGLTRSVDDLGSQGEPPTHPELLDWLAAEFMDSGWDVKHMVRLIVTSETYRQSSQADPQWVQRDPLNRLFARQNARRLDAEMIRDNALQISGLLVSQVGGPSVMPYQPAGYWDQLNFPKRTYQHDQGAKQYRRGLYTHWQRTFLHPSMLAFDAPAREECTAQRERSNTPLQALVLLNDPTYVEAARVFAARVLENGPAKNDQADADFATRLDWLFKQAVGRSPEKQEAEILQRLFAESHSRYQQDAEAATRLLAVGEYPLNKSLDPIELASWTAVTRAVLNLHETFTRY